MSTRSTGSPRPSRGTDPSLVRGFWLATVLALALATTGCAVLTPVELAWLPGTTPGSQIQAELGAPARIWPEADGGRTLEYSTQPMGQRCLMVRLGADGRLISATDTLQAAQRARIVAGMSQEQVSRWLGQERSRVLFALSGEEVWDWTVPPEAGSHGLRFNVHFIAGQVVRTSHSLVFADDRLWPWR